MFLFREETFIVWRGEHVLDGWVTENGDGVANDKEDEAPWKEVRGYEEQA